MPHETNLNVKIKAFVHRTEVTKIIVQIRAILELKFMPDVIEIEEVVR